MLRHSILAIQSPPHHPDHHIGVDLLKSRNYHPLARATLGRMAGFRDCPSEILDGLAENGALRNYTAGEFVVRKGGENQYLMVVIEGELECSVMRASGSKHLFGFHRPGECTGLISLTEGPGHVI